MALTNEMAVFRSNWIPSVLHFATSENKEKRNVCALQIFLMYQALF
jgi:hypothetical protein